MRIALAVLVALAPSLAFAIRAAPPALEAKVTIGPATKRVGPLPSEDLERTVKARSGVFRACYQKELGTKPTLKGKVVLEFSVEPDGTVKTVQVAKGTTLKNDNVTACLQSNVIRLAFPNADATTKIVYPMTFSSTKTRR